MRFWLLLAAVMAFATTAVPATAADGDKVALVIGNSAYERPLPNAKNDAESMTKALGAIGFEVIVGLDLDRAGMERKVREFVAELPDAKIALFFYAGHAMQADGRNYLIPVDAVMADATALEFETVKADEILAYMGGNERIAIAFLDACRDNPLARSFMRSLGQAHNRNYEIKDGLADIKAATGSFIGYSTAPGDVAADGTGANSPFTTALIKHIATPGLEIKSMMTRVTADVYEVTKGDQEPWMNASLRSEIFLAGEITPDERAWDVTKDTTTVAVVEDFLFRFPDSPRAADARALIAALTESAVDDNRSMAAEPLPPTTIEPPPQVAAPTNPPTTPDNRVALLDLDNIDVGKVPVRSYSLIVPDDGVAATACDEFGASPEAHIAAATVVYDSLYAPLSRALSACTEAMEQYPLVDRFIYQFARAHRLTTARDNYGAPSPLPEAAHAKLQAAASRGYGPALFELALSTEDAAVKGDLLAAASRAGMPVAAARVAYDTSSVAAIEALRTRVATGDEAFAKSSGVLGILGELSTPEDARSLKQRLAELGDPAAMRPHAYSLWEQGAQQGAIEWFDAAAKAGDTLGFLNVARIYSGYEPSLQGETDDVATPDFEKAADALVAYIESVEPEYLGYVVGDRLAPRAQDALKQRLVSRGFFEELDQTRDTLAEAVFAAAKAAADARPASRAPDDSYTDTRVALLDLDNIDIEQIPARDYSLIIPDEGVPANDCDLYGASPEAHIEGVEPVFDIEEQVLEKAVEACTIAMAQHPEIDRFVYQLARAHWHTATYYTDVDDLPLPDAVYARLEAAGRAGFAPALVEIGRMKKGTANQLPFFRAADRAGMPEGLGLRVWHGENGEGAEDFDRMVESGNKSILRSPQIAYIRYIGKDPKARTAEGKDYADTGDPVGMYLHGYALWLSGDAMGSLAAFENAATAGDEDSYLNVARIHSGFPPENAEPIPGAIAPDSEKAAAALLAYAHSYKPRRLAALYDWNWPIEVIEAMQRKFKALGLFDETVESRDTIYEAANAAAEQ